MKNEVPVESNSAVKVVESDAQAPNDRSPSWAGRLRERATVSLGPVGAGLAVFLVVEIVVFTILSPYFLTANNVSNIGRAGTIIGISAVGQTIVMIAGGFDLSVASVMAAAGMVAAYITNAGGSFALAVVAAIVGGIAVGLLNGVVIGYARINPLIATLATLSIVRGLGYVVTGGESISVKNSTFLSFGTGSLFGVPYIVVFLVVLFVGAGVLLPRTSSGRYVYAIGSNERAARLAGVRVARWKLAFYALCGALAAVAGVVTVARTGVADPSANIGAELNVITAVILGGTSLAGGRGTLTGTFLGLLVLGVLTNGMVLVGVQSYWQQVVQGLVLLIAVSYDEFSRSRTD